MIIGTVVTGVILLVFTAEAPVAVLVVGALVVGITQSIVLIGYITLRTALSPDAMLGRMGALLLVASGCFALVPNPRRVRVPRPGRQAAA